MPWYAGGRQTWAVAQRRRVAAVLLLVLVGEQGQPPLPAGLEVPLPVCVGSPFLESKCSVADVG